MTVILDWEWMWKEAALRCYRSVYLERLKETSRNLTQDSWPPGRESNLVLSYYEVRMLISKSPCSAVPLAT